MRPRSVGNYAGSVTTVLEWLRRTDDNEFEYPNWMLVLAHGALIAIVVGALIQRHDSDWLWLAVIGGVVTLAEDVRHMFTLTPSGLGMMVTAIAGTSLMLVESVYYDIAPAILIIAVIDVAVMCAIRDSIAANWAAKIVLVGAFLFGHLSIPSLIYGLVFTEVGWLLGVLIRNQALLLVKERQAQAERETQAAAEERRRIAREVHDVIAHSLSVTLLQITGARRALADHDIDDAVDALTDAERIGRQAMADIRKTVGLLSSEPSKTTAEPGIAEIDDLIADFRRAGMPVEYRFNGELPAVTAVTAATGLGLYRVAQESLANIAKHAPGAGADVSVDVGAGRVALAIRNDLRGAPKLGAGTGLLGMRQRIEQLGGWLNAGPDDKGWIVHAEIPVEHACFLRKVVQ